MRVLALSSWWPEPPDNGSRVRIARLLEALVGAHEVHLLALSADPVSPEQQARLGSVCASARAIRQCSRPAGYTDRIASIRQPIPRSVRTSYTPEFATAVQQAAEQLRPDAVLVFELGAAPYAKLVPGVPRVLDEIQLAVLREQYIREQRPLQRLRYWLTWRQHCRYLRWLLQSFDRCTVVSEQERQLLRGVVPGTDITALPNGADIADRATPDTVDPDTLIYPGAVSFDANFDAMRFFVERIFPDIRRGRPPTRLRITGRAEPAQREALSAEGVEWTGYLPDVRSLIARTWCEVIPLRRGGGTRLKVLEALALGTPVVSTGKGIEGLELRPGRDVLVADTPAEFAAATLKLLGEPHLRLQLSAAGRRAVEAHYDWRAIGRGMETLLAGAVARRPR